MTDPVSGQAASQAVEAMQQSGALEGPEQVDSAANFADAMNSAADGGAEAAEVDGVDQIDQIDQIDGVDQIDQVDQVNEIPTDDFIQRLLSEESEIQKMMDKCLSGADLGQEEMLQMQAVIYSYSQRVELTSKVVDNATGGIKQVMNTQV